MGCNCNKTAAKVEFVYTAPGGARTVYKTEVEAQAAKIRNGGGTYQRVNK